MNAFNYTGDFPTTVVFGKEGLWKEKLVLKLKTPAETVVTIFIQCRNTLLRRVFGQSFKVFEAPSSQSNGNRSFDTLLICCCFFLADGISDAIEDFDPKARSFSCSSSRR